MKAFGSQGTRTERHEFLARTIHGTAVSSLQSEIQARSRSWGTRWLLLRGSEVEAFLGSWARGSGALTRDTRARDPDPEAIAHV